MSIPTRQTPPPSTVPATPMHQSSPAKACKYYAEHKRGFYHFLGIPEDVLKQFRRPSKLKKFSFTKFVAPANQLSAAVQEKYFPDRPLLVFKDIQDEQPAGHIAGTDCKPDFAAAYKDDWTVGVTGAPTALWSRLELVGEDASKGKSKKDQEIQAISYLHYLLLARPDLFVAQGLLTAENGVTFLLGIGGFGIRSYYVPWGAALAKLVYLSIYRLYSPGRFKDESYTQTESIFKGNTVSYTLRLTNGLTLSGFQPIYASSPFRGRTHVLSNPTSDIPPENPIRVIKDQLSHVGRRFNENEILGTIHKAGPVPGVVKLAYHEAIDNPFNNKQVRHRLGLEECGLPFMAIPNLKTMLEVVYDTVEVIRYLRIERRVLHRDISKNNVMFMSDEAMARLATKPSNEDEDDLCFIRYLLDNESSNRRETRVLIIDFNFGEDLSAKTDPNEYKRISITGTPCFIARAVENREALPFKDSKVLQAVPPCPSVRSQFIPTRSARFPRKPRAFLDPAEGSPAFPPFRHELDHDVESAFWLLFYWAMLAKPIISSGNPDEFIDAFVWTGFQGSWNARHTLLLTEVPAAHVHFHLLSDLVHKLGKIIYFDRSWWSRAESEDQSDCDPRAHLEYSAEAVQRLILQFLIVNRDKPFMTDKVDRQRSRKPAPGSLYCPSLSSESNTGVAKRSLFSTPIAAPR